MPAMYLSRWARHMLACNKEAEDIASLRPASIEVRAALDAGEREAMLSSALTMAVKLLTVDRASRKSETVSPCVLTKDAFTLVGAAS